MTNYKELYLKMFRASEKAVRILIETQQECEELYLEEPDPRLNILPLSPDDDKSTDS